MVKLASGHQAFLELQTMGEERQLRVSNSTESVRVLKLTHFLNVFRAKFWEKLIRVLGSSDKPMKWSDSKQLAAYTLARSIALVPNLALLTAFAVQGQYA